MASINSAAPFRFFGLPREIQLHILSYTDLVAPMSVIRWNPRSRYHLSVARRQCWIPLSAADCTPPYDQCHPDLHQNCSNLLRPELIPDYWDADADGTMDEAIEGNRRLHEQQGVQFCACPHAHRLRPARSACSRCPHYACQFFPPRVGGAAQQHHRQRYWLPPTPLFLVSRDFRDLCNSVFGSWNQIKIDQGIPHAILWMTENGGAPLPHGPAVRHPVAVFFDQFVGRDLVRQLRRLELDAEDSSNNIPGLIPDDDDRRVRDFVHVMRKASSMLNLRHLKIENLSAPAATASWDELAAMSAETLVEFVRGVIAKLVWPALSDWPSRGQAGTASGDMTGVRRTVDGMGSVDRFIVKMTFGYSIVIRYYRGVADSDALAGQWWEGAEMSASINLGGSGNLQGDVDGGWVEQVLLNQIT